MYTSFIAAEASTVFILNQFASLINHWLAADLWIGLSSPPNNILYSGRIKSMWPLQLVVITGLPVIACSSNGRPKPSPLVNEINA